MRASLALPSMTVSAILTLFPTGAGADSECYKGYRDITSAERAAMINVLEAALEVMPSAPDGWEVARQDELYVAPSVCRDNESLPWRYDFSRSYRRIDDFDARDQALGDAAARMQTDMKAKQPSMDAVIARIQELSMAAVAAAEKGDYDKAEKINAEIEEASAEMERIMADGGTLDRMDEAADAANRDTSIYIEVEVNSGHGLFGYGAESMTAPPGADGAYRWTKMEGGNVNETRMVLFGRWRTDGEAFDPVFHPGAAPTAAQTVSITVTADESRTESVVDAIDFRKVAASITR